MMASFLFLSLALLLGLGVAGVFIWYLMRPNPEGTSHTQSLANAALYRSQILTWTASGKTVTSASRSGNRHATS